MPTGDPDDETCTTFVLHEEDHTLGNSLRYIIMKKYEGWGGGLNGTAYYIFFLLSTYRLMLPCMSFKSAPCDI